MYHTLVGTTQWGDSLDKLGWYGPDEFRFHPSCHPHAMVVSFFKDFFKKKDVRLNRSALQVPAKSPHLLAIYCWTGDVNGDYWYTE